MLASLGNVEPRFAARALAPMLVTVLVGWAVLAGAVDHASIGTFAAMWMAMAVAMMLPTVLRPMMRAAEGSPLRAWQFVAGFVGIWALVGVPAYALMNAIEWTTFWIALAWIAAGLYQVTPVMHRFVRSCSGVTYTGSPMRYGVRQGIRCVASCSPVMLAAMVTAMALPGFVAPILVLVALTAFLCWEKQPSASREVMTAVGMGMIVLAVTGVMVLGGGGGHLH